MRSWRCLIPLAILLAGPALSAEAPRWPIPGAIPDNLDDYVPFVQPTASGEPESALFGCVRTNGQRFHEAIDLAPVQQLRRGEATDPVRAIHGGIVRHISTVSGNSSYGRYVVVEHPGLNLAAYTLYAHLATVDKGLKVGQVVPAGAELGIMGRSAGGYTIPRERAHLHLEVGLRLSDRFQDWYQRQPFDSPNKHGNFNGMNLIGWDPLDYYRAFQSGRVASPLEYVSQLAPAAMVHVRTQRRPDFADRYPELVLPGCPPEEQAGWEVLLSAWGLPIALKPLSERELNGVAADGDISVVGIDQTRLDAYACRRLVSGSRDKVVLGSTGRMIFELLFMPSPDGD